MQLAILDRDGVINYDSPNYIKSPDEWQALPGSLEAIAKLSQAGWTVVVATNQSGLARGLFSVQTLNAIHAKMREQVVAAGGFIDAIFICPHHPDDQCLCRKPAPGLFQDIAKRYDTPLLGVPTVGDSLRDLLAGTQAGCQPWLVLTGNGNQALASPELPEHTQVGVNLLDVVKQWLGDDSPSVAGKLA